MCERQNRGSLPVRRELVDVAAQFVNPRPIAQGRRPHEVPGALDRIEPKRLGAAAVEMLGELTRQLYRYLAVRRSMPLEVRHRLAYVDGRVPPFPVAFGGPVNLLAGEFGGAFHMAIRFVTGTNPIGRHFPSLPNRSYYNAGFRRMLTPNKQLRRMPKDDGHDLTKYLADLREVDQEVTAYAVALVEERFAQQGLPPVRQIAGSRNWESFAFDLSCALDHYLLPDQPAEWVRALVRDLWTFCECNQSGSPGYRFARLLYALSYSNRIRLCGLPPEVENCYKMAGEWTEEDRLREWQQGY